jgi:hypothetical protein
MDRPYWLRWSDELQTIASAGLTYSRDTFDRDRFEQIRAIAAEILSRHTDLVLPEASRPSAARSPGECEHCIERKLSSAAAKRTRSRRALR